MSALTPGALADACHYHACPSPSWKGEEKTEAGRAETPRGPMHFACFKKWRGERLLER